MSQGVHHRGSLRARRPGLLFCLILALGCARDGDPPRDVVRLEGGDVQLPEGAERHDVMLEGVGADDEVSPETVQAGPRDAVAFTAADGVTHSIAFLGDHLDSAQIAFLETRGQMRGPPLLAEGASWIVTLDDAPPGDYPFACTLHGGQGVIRVGTR